jgi:serine/threonine protein kinase
MGRGAVSTLPGSSEPLEHYATSNAPLANDEVAWIVVQIAQVLQAAHSAGIVHRDLKPDNVMYEPRTRRITLLDFGDATGADGKTDQRLAAQGFVVGTLMYVAPESLSGEKLSGAADQYSLAIIAYYLLTACLPYAARTPRAIVAQLLSQPPIPLSHVRLDLRFTPRVETVVMRGQSKRPAERYPDILTFARELQAALIV